MPAPERFAKRSQPNNSCLKGAVTIICIFQHIRSEYQLVKMRPLSTSMPGAWPSTPPSPASSFHSTHIVDIPDFEQLEPTKATVVRPKIQDPTIPPEDGSCPFLRLPGELRNEIYKHALTERLGRLFYRVPNHGPELLKQPWKDQVSHYRRGKLHAYLYETKEANQLQIRQQTTSTRNPWVGSEVQYIILHAFVKTISRRNSPRLHLACQSAGVFV